MLEAVALDDDLRRIAAAAAAFATGTEAVEGVLPAEAHGGERIYVCAFAGLQEERSWLALDAVGRPVQRRATVRDAVSIAALCEFAEETAVGGDLDELLAQLVALRITEHPQGIEEAEAAVLELQRVVGASPRVASPDHLEAVEKATRRVEQTLGDGGPSPFAEGMKAALAAVESLTVEVERGYKQPLT